MRRRGAALVLAVALLSGCARRLPRGIAERYLEHLQQFDYAACYQLLSQRDRAARSLPEFLTEIPLAPAVSPVWFRPVLHQTHYELGPEQRGVDRLTAVVAVKVTAPDLPLWERRLNAASGHGGVPAAVVQHALDQGDYPRRVYDDQIFLVKEHHHWRVVAGFVARDKIIGQHQQAMNDYLLQRYDKAIPEWRSLIMELQTTAGTGNPGLADQYRRELALIDPPAPARAEAQAYLPQLKLSDVAMKMSEDRVPAIFGTVRNSGNRPVDALGLKVTWYTGRGKDLKMVQTEAHPIVVTPIVFTDFTQPVRPFLPGESRSFGVTLSAPALVQQQASPYVTIGTILLSSLPASASVPVGKTSTRPTTPHPTPASTAGHALATVRPTP